MTPVRRISRMLSWPLAGCLVMASAACTPDRNAGQDAPRPSAPTTSLRADPGGSPSSDGQESCAVAVDAMREPPDDYRIVGEDVAVPDREVLQASESGEPDPAARLFAKWGLVVRAGAVVDLRVASGWEDRARLGWGNPAKPAVSVQVRACAAADDDQSQWLAFVGGTWVAQPTCLPLTIRSQEQTMQVRLGIGVPCDE